MNIDEIETCADTPTDRQDTPLEYRHTCIVAKAAVTEAGN